jgi:hypothetical protein
MRRAPIIVLSALTLLLTAGGAAAEDKATPSREQSRRSSAEILAHIEQPEAEESWLSYHLNRIHVHDEAGLAYTRPLRLADRHVELSLRGPARSAPEGVLDGLQLGISFEIRF